MVDIKKLENDARAYANAAVEADRNGKLDEAVSYYAEAAQALICIRGSLLASPESKNNVGLDPEKLLVPISNYIERAECIKGLIKQKPVASLHLKNTVEVSVERAKYLMSQALSADEQKQYAHAFGFYQDAAELCLKDLKTVDQPVLKDKIRQIVARALERAEVLKKTYLSEGSRIRLPSPPREEDEQPLDIDTKNITIHDNRQSLSVSEIRVLRRSSRINGVDYVPFLKVDLHERFAFPQPFEDSFGTLKLAPKQAKHLARWARPSEIMSDPKMVVVLSYFSIKQELISDCSFVASLAVSVQYEKKFNKRLITSIIYPQNAQGESVYNPCGKYMVRLHINGIWRKVIIDDRLPVDHNNRLLCSATTNKNELWVSLIEKAYMKVMGGYDFPGSNSTVDLHALTGWIPELVPLRSDSNFDKDREFRQMYKHFHAGNVLITVATPQLSKVDEERTGLVSSHAYALLDIREVKGHRLFMLKNPWSHVEWKGNFSDFDKRNWTPELIKELNYDPKLQVDVDNGVFWIDYHSLLHHFDNFYLNWSPSMFSYTSCIHGIWPVNQGPVKDLLNLGDNPQYVLRVNSSQKASLMILLTRHITEIEDFAMNRIFITLFVYKSGGKRIYYPNDFKPLKDGVKTNSAHYLVRLVTEDSDTAGATSYTIVLSQYEKRVDIFYSLRVYSTSEFSLSPVQDPYDPKYNQEIQGQWKGESAGGCQNNSSTYKNNPLYQLVLDNHSTNNHIKIELAGPKAFQVGFEVRCTETKVPNCPTEFHKTDTGSYRTGFCLLTLDNIPGGTYTIRPATFEAGKESIFLLRIASSHPYSLKKL